MNWVFTIIGVLVGAAIGKEESLIFGAAIGFLFGAYFNEKKRVGELSDRLREVELNQESLSNNTAINNKDTRSQNPEPIPAQNQDPQLTPDLNLELDLELDYSHVAEAPAATNQPAITKPAVDQEPQTASASIVDGTTPKKVAVSYSEKLAAEKAALDTGNASSKGFEKALHSVKRYFTEGNIIVRIGIVVLFFGVSFLVKYSIENSIVPVEVRMIAVVLGGLALLTLGWRLRNKVPGYAMAIQGGAIGMIYLAIFASFRMYQLIPASFAFPLLIIFSVLGMLLAVLQGSKSLAITAIVGGFASPILASTGSGNYIALFSYYTVLNLSVFGVSWFKSWRMLNVVGFAFTFVIGTLWGVTQYHPNNFATTEPFLLIFFLIYVAISIMFAFKQEPQLKGYVDGTLVFGVPLVGFSLQAALVYNTEYGLAISAFVLGFFYLCVARILWNNSNTNFRLLCEAMLALGVIFTSLTIPFALDGRWTAAAWAVEGAGFVWVGIRQHRLLVKYFGVLLQLGAGLLYIVDFPYSHNATAFLNGEYVGSLMVSIAALITSFQFSNDKSEHLGSKLEKQFKPDIVFLALGLAWWYGGGLIQFDRHLHWRNEIAPHLAFFAISAIIWLASNLRYQWRQFNFFPYLLLAPLYFYFVFTLDSHPFSHWGFLAWPGAFAVNYFIYFLADKHIYTLSTPKILHLMSYVLLTLVVAFEGAWQISNQGLADCWEAAFMGLVLVGALQGIDRFTFWPFAAHQDTYKHATALGIIVLLVLWTAFLNFNNYLAPSPLPYVPLLNPMDIIQALALMVTIEWYRQTGHKLLVGVSTQQVLAVLAAFCFVWFNVMMFKTLHVMSGVSYRTWPLFNSALVQMSVSISWTLIGLAVMIIASRKLHRRLWIIGAALTGIVVAKLFLLDLSDRGTIERIVSFMVVGILLLVVGYFSPVPPNAQADESKEGTV